MHGAAFSIPITHAAPFEITIICIYVAVTINFSMHLYFLLQYKKMKDTALQASRISPSPVSWRAVGIACYYVSCSNTMSLL